MEDAEDEIWRVGLVEGGVWLSPLFVRPVPEIDRGSLVDDGGGGDVDGDVDMAGG